MGIELIRFDDLPGTVDASLDFKCTADGDFSLLVIDVSGSIPSRRNAYRLLVDDAVATNDFVLSSLEKIDVPVDGQTDQVYKLTRLGDLEGRDQDHLRRLAGRNHRTGSRGRGQSSAASSH